MKHTVDELLIIIYQHYWRTTSYEQSEPWGARENLVEARKLAGKPNSPWRELLTRLYARFPNRVLNGSLHLPTGEFDACYRVTLQHQPHDLGLAISFLAPYYVVYSSLHVDKTKYTYDEVWRLHPFDLADDEVAEADVMVDEMKTLFPNHEPMPEKVGNIVVPDVLAGNQLLGMATIYQCFFTENWWQVIQIWPAFFVARSSTALDQGTGMHARRFNT